MRFASRTSVCYSSAIFFVNLRVLETADVTVAMAIRKASKMADEGEMLLLLKKSSEKNVFFLPEWGINLRGVVFGIIKTISLSNVNN